MTFRPPSCPHEHCPSSTGSIPFRWQRRGSFRRACDGRLVLRYFCLGCRRGFSMQTFRVDYRLKKPRLEGPIFASFISKVSHRQCARVLGVTRATVERRLVRYGAQCRALHRVRLQPESLTGVFQLDEGETFEGDRRERPLTLPVLIERGSRFIVHVETAPIAARTAPRSRGTRPRRSTAKRKSGSNAAVRRCFEVLARCLRREASPLVQTDRKATYPGMLELAFGARTIRHERTSSKLKRDRRNPLFAINHTLAMLRDGLSRLVRRTWAHAKLAARLESHLWIYVAWRNYVRGVTNKARKRTPAMKLEIERERWTIAGLLHWSARFPDLLHAH